MTTRCYRGIQWSIRSPTSGWQKRDGGDGLQLFRTKQDGGETSLYGIGRYHDEIALEGGIPRLLSREVRMTTRQLGTGSQIPL
jgi:hypothetical protein